MIQSPYQKYQNIQTQTANKGQLLIMLYDGAIRFVKIGIEGIENHKYELANNNLLKAQAIIHELMATLNFNYEISSQLSMIYEYMLHRLIQANISKSKEPATEILNYLQELKDAWVQAAGKGDRK